MKRKILDNGNIWQKSDGRWIGMVRYKDEYGVTQRKSFSSKKKKTLQAKMTEYVANFQEQVSNSNESRKPLKDSMTNWLQVYKFPEVERTTYDRYECTAKHQSEVLPQRIYFTGDTVNELLYDIGYHSNYQRVNNDLRNHGNILINTSAEYINDEAIDNFVIAYVFRYISSFPL